MTDYELIHRYNDLITSIYGESIDEVLLDTARKIAEFVPYTHSMVSFCCGRGNSLSLFGTKSDDIPQDMIEIYDSRFRPLDYTWWYIKQLQEQGEAFVIRATDIVTERVIETSTIHREWHEPLGLFYTACVCVAAKGELYGFISLLRSKEAGDFNVQELHFLEYVNSHLVKRFSEAYPDGLTAPDQDDTGGAFGASGLLSERELEIVDLLVSGIPRTQIAQQLFISPNTLKKHISNIYGKLGISSISQLHAMVSRRA